MSVPWRLVFTPAAAGELRRLSVRSSLRGSERIADLATDPFPPSSRKVVGRAYWRIRVGDVRVVYAVDEADRLVTILRVARRAETTYRRLPR